jgi:hypothetical protein
MKRPRSFAQSGDQTHGFACPVIPDSISGRAIRSSMRAMHFLPS